MESCRWRVAVWAIGMLIPMGLQAQSPQFRGDARHAGVVETRGVESFGGVAWRFKTGGAVRSTAALADGWLYVGSSDGMLYALDADTGALRWRFDAGAPIASSPAVAGGVVLVGSRDGVLHGVSTATGRSLWRLQTGPDLPLAWAPGGWDYLQSSPALADGTAYWGSGDGHVLAVDPQTGAERWRFRTGGRVRSTPAVRGDLLVVGSSDGVVYALNASTGAERWRFETRGAHLDGADFGFDRRQISASPTLFDDMVYVGSRDASLYALSAHDGEQRWRFDEGSAWIISTVAATPTRVFSARSSSGNLRAIDRASGEQLWAVSTGSLVFSSPVLVEGTLYIGREDGALAAYDAATGDLRWSYDTGGGIWATPVVHAGRVYIGSDDGYIYALAAAEGPALERAVFFDESLRSQSAFGAVPQHDAAHDFFQRRGYASLDGAGLVEFLEARIMDEAPSVIVFAMDALPVQAGGASSGVPLLRRYLDAGGKVVWMGYLPEYILRDPTSGQVTGTDTDRPSSLLSVDFSAYDGDSYGVQPTETGVRWGLESPWVGQGTTLPHDVTSVLAVDEIGRAVAWVENYGGHAGTGFVFARATTSETILAEIQRVAEYGLAGGDGSR